jgi:hypothetical protein
MDPAYNVDEDPDADADFYLMRMLIQVTKMMRIDAEPDPQHCTVVTDAVLSVQIKTMSRGSPDNKKEAQLM